MRETWVWSLGQEDPLEKEMAPHSSTLAWKIPWMEEPGGLQSMGSQRVRHDWVASVSIAWKHASQHPWDSPGKNTGVGCHFLLRCVKVKSESEVAQSCLTHSDPMDCSPPGSSVHGIFQARVLEWDAIAFSSTSLIITNNKWQGCGEIWNLMHC